MVLAERSMHASGAWKQVSMLEETGVVLRC
jgi:hypothetical protein